MGGEAEGETGVDEDKESDRAQPDFLLPTPVENLLKKKSEQPDTASPPVPPRGQKKEGIYDSIPASLKSELIVKSVEQDQELVAERQETIRTHTPAQLSEIHSLAD